MIRAALIFYFRLSPSEALAEIMADNDDDDFDVLGMYVEDEEDSAAAAAKEEAKQKRREHFQQMGPPPPPPLSPEEMARSQINDEMHQKLWEYDPKTRFSFYTRYWFAADFTKFDIDEETQYGPMRFTDSVIQEGHELTDESLNVLCLKIQSSDVGFPINVYGTVIMRDDLDYRCNYIFRRDRDNCQLIKSQGDSLILTGPSRGAVFLGNVYVEIDLKIREDAEERNDRQFHTVIEHVDALRIQHRVERRIIDSWLSDVELVFAHVKKPLEGTVEIKILSGPECFVGKIAACTTDLPDDHQMLLYDYDSVGGTVIAGPGADRVIRLFRRVVVVSSDQMLVFRLWDDSSRICPSCISIFTPRINGSEWDLVTCGLYRLQIKVVWSTLM